MPIATLNRSISATVLALGLVFMAGCGEDESPLTPPRINPLRPKQGTPIEIRDDAASYGLKHELTIGSTDLDESTLRLDIAYGGGCKEHSFSGIAASTFSGSEVPRQLDLYVRHDGEPDYCAALWFKQLAFDITPAIRLYEATYGRREHFLLRIHTPSASDPVVIPVPASTRLSARRPG